MKSHKIQVTTNALEQPNLSAYLQVEPSAKRRANIIKRLAELGAMLEKMGLTNLTTGSLATSSPPMRINASAHEGRLLDADLGSEFFDNALSGFMTSPSQDSDNDPALGRRPDQV